jgi:putative tryptophan/tyrosine transport system substrate-binding protein
MLPKLTTPSSQFRASRKVASLSNLMPSPLAARHRLPAIYPYRYFAADGGLLSYGPDFNEWWRRAPSYVDKILKGASPGDLPIQQPTKFELIINLKTAKALSLTIPPQFLDRADELIE